MVVKTLLSSDGEIGSLKSTVSRGWDSKEEEERIGKERRWEEDEERVGKIREKKRKEENRKGDERKEEEDKEEKKRVGKRKEEKREESKEDKGSRIEGWRYGRDYRFKESKRTEWGNGRWKKKRRGDNRRWYTIESNYIRKVEKEGESVRVKGCNHDQTNFVPAYQDPRVLREEVEGNLLIQRDIYSAEEGNGQRMHLFK